MLSLYSKILLILSLFSFSIATWMLLKSTCFIYQLHLFYMGYLSISFEFLMDFWSLTFLSLVSVISSLVLTYSKDYMSTEIYKERFCLLVVLFILSMSWLILSSNLITLIFGWDGLGLVSYCLIVFYQNITSYQGGFITFYINRLGDFSFFMALVLLYPSNWNILMSETSLSVSSMTCLILAAMTKSAQFPFSSWLPEAMAAPTPVSALVHSSTLVTAGVYMLIRFNYLFNVSNFQNYLMWISIFTILMAGLSAVVEKDFKKIIALSTLSQMGFMFLSLSNNFWELAYFHMLTHAIFKSLFFLSAGNYIHQFNGQQDIRFYGGLKNMTPLTSASLMLSNLSLMGMPFLSGFYSKDLLIESILSNKWNILALTSINLGLACTIVYSIRLTTLLLWVTYQGSTFYPNKNEFMMNMSMIILTTISIWLGSMLWWWIPFSSMYNSILIFNWVKITLIITILYSLWNINLWKMKSKLLLGGDLWALKSLSFYLLMLHFYTPSNFMKSEITWGEMSGAQGIYIMLNKMFFWIIKSQYNWLISSLLFLFWIMVNLF